MFSFDAGRFLEYTHTFFQDEFRGLDENAQAKLLTIPVLFTYETGGEAPSRVGRLRSLSVTGNTMDFQVDFDDEIGPIDTKKLEELKAELGIEKTFELHRTHWAIKEGDLFQILDDAGLLGRANRLTVAAFIVDHIETAGEPVTIDQVRAAFRDASYSVIDKTMRGELSRLAKIGTIKRVRKGLYASSTWMASPKSSPVTPEAGPGPQYGVRDGKLAILSAVPTEDEQTAQERLVARLKRDLAALVELSKPIGNSHPHLAGAIAEYRELMSVNIDELDVTGLWAVGSSLAGYAQAFREQNVARTLSEPLEPQLDGLLQSVVRQHGALILGFEEGRDLVRRADEFALDRDRLAEIEEPGNELLGELSENSELVDDATRAVHTPVRDYLHDVGWAVNRAGYTGYLIIRNSVRAAIHLTVGREINIAAIAGALVGVSAIAGDPSMEFLRATLPFLREYGAQLCAFFNHSPEMRAYVEWALSVIEEVEATQGREKES